MNKQELENRLTQAYKDRDSINENIKELEKQKKDLETTYHIGQRFIVRGHLTSDKYILAQSGFFRCCLINLKNGNRWYDEIKVDNLLKITRSEMNRIAGDDCKYELIEE